MDDPPVDRWKPQPGTLDEHVDELPTDLDVAGYVGPYLFPDNKRRRIAGALYAAAGAVLLLIWALGHDGGVLVNDGFLVAGVVGLALGAYHQLAGYPLVVRDLRALTVAASTVGFPIGHASAQLGWRGLRSRPTWRILVYSADDPPSQRGLVLVDGVDGSVVDHIVEDNPEDWSEFAVTRGD
ncbi:MAG: hypothetical protein ACYDH6_16905 [Acidimicrobiales bacterium]